MHVLLWIAIIFLAGAVVWFVAIAHRVRKLRRAYRRILGEPVANWLPPETLTPIPVPSLDGVDWRTRCRDVDDEGVYLVDYDAHGQRGVSGRRRNPANIAVFGILRARAYVESGNHDDLLLALRQFDHIARDARPVTVAGQESVVWCADFDVGYQYGTKAPWTSAYFHNYCMAALVWASALTGKGHYRALAEKAVGALGATVSEGGLSYRTAGGGLFLEEVVSAPLHHILNGHMTTLVGLLRYAALTGSQQAKDVAAKGVRGTVNMLPSFDKHGYSLYSLHPHPTIENHFNIASPSYHHKHIALLRTLHEMTGQSVFEDYADRWQQRSGTLFDLLWTATFVAFKDVMRLAKVVRRIGR